jgi:hypothetical protein
MVSGGFRPTASQNNPMSVSGDGGNGQSGKFVEKKAEKAAQLRMSGLPQGENTAVAQQISQGGNVSTTANGANPASKVPSGMGLAELLGSLDPLDSEPVEFRPISDGLLQSGASLGATTPGSGLDPVANALAGRSAALGTKKSLEKAGIEVGDTGPLKVLDPVLKVAAKADEYVFTPLIKRPTATAFLVTDPDSPLYKKPEFQKGFQLSDIAEAYKRTGNVYETIEGETYLKEAGVSLGQAFNKSLIAEISL